MRKVGELKGKVVVAGNKNLVTANQIHYEEKDGNITLSERRRGGELSSVTGSGSSSSDNNQNDNGFSCYEYIKINGEELISFLTEDLLSMLGLSKFILPNVLCAYGDYESSMGHWKALVDRPIYEAFVTYDYNSFKNIFEVPYDKYPIYGYKFNNIISTISTSEGVMGSPFMDLTIFENIIDKDFINNLGIGLCILLLLIHSVNNPESTDNPNEAFKSLMDVVEFKKITLEEYHTTQYQKAKEHYDSLEPVS